MKLRIIPSLLIHEMISGYVGSIRHIFWVCSRILIHEASAKTFYGRGWQRPQWCLRKKKEKSLINGQERAASKNVQRLTKRRTMHENWAISYQRVCYVICTYLHSCLCQLCCTYGAWDLERESTISIVNTVIRSRINSLNNVAEWQESKTA